MKISTEKREFYITAQMHEHALYLTSSSGKELYTSSEKLVDGIIKVADYYKFDRPVLGYDVYNIEAEAMGQGIVFYEDSSPQLKQNKYLLNKEDLERLEPPEPGKSGRMPFTVAANKLFYRKTGLVPPLQFCAPFSLAAVIYGFDRLVVELVLDPPFVHRLMEFITDRILIPWISYQQQELPEFRFVFGADALASPPNLGLEHIKEFVTPYILRLKAECGQSVGVVNWWGESHVKDIDDFLKQKVLVSPGNRILRVQDPDLDLVGAGVITDFALAADLELTLGLSAQLINNGPVREIKNRVRRYMQEGLRVPSYSLYLCNIGSSTPENNISRHCRSPVNTIQIINIICFYLFIYLMAEGEGLAGIYLGADGIQGGHRG